MSTDKKKWDAVVIEDIKDTKKLNNFCKQTLQELCWHTFYTALMLNAVKKC